jgi:uncharacterized protein (DUF433 family)
MTTPTAQNVLVFDNDRVPLRYDKYGAVRVIGSRVTLDTIVGYYEQGESPEEIADGFSTLQLADVYAIVGYYLKHKTAVRAYLREREKRANALRKKMQARSNPRDLKKRLTARRKTIATRA